MERAEKILAHLDHLESIEPSAEWNHRLMSRINAREHRINKINFISILLIATFFLAAINLLSLTTGRHQNMARENSNELKNIASDFLITTNSSKY